MTQSNWKVHPSEVLNASPVMPVMVIQDAADAVPLARALMAGGIKVLEITLRTAAAMDSIKAISQEVEGALVGAGTITTPEQLQAVSEAGAVFAISPGLTPKLLAAANKSDIALIPGIATVSELMLGMEYGLDHFKFFPAEAAGCIPMLKGIAGPIPQITFCPTGGISPSNYNDYLALKNVACVGGSWLVPAEAVGQCKNLVKQRRVGRFVAQPRIVFRVPNTGTIHKIAGVWDE
jgi:2-dehydro-3-deoxyphosphogluconate aldolase/(4S)-4-hydroxy-2-oxoglutarate aldolase